MVDYTSEVAIPADEEARQSVVEDAFDTIREKLQVFHGHLLGRGFVDPKVKFECEDVLHRNWCLYARVSYPAELNLPIKYHFRWGSTFEEAYRDLFDAFAEIPDPDAAEEQDLRKKLAAVIERARDMGKDTNFLNPLEEMMKQLSENIIEHHPEVAE